MVRTANSHVHTSSGKSSKKGGAARSTFRSSPSTSGWSTSSEKAGGGGNPVCHRETPGWQKPITNFFSKGPKIIETVPKAGSSSAYKTGNILKDTSNQDRIQQKPTETAVIATESRRNLEADIEKENMNDNSVSDYSILEPEVCIMEVDEKVKKIEYDKFNHEEFEGEQQ